MAQDFSKLSKADLIKLLSEKESAAPAPAVEAPVAPAPTQISAQDLMAALIAAREVAVTPAPTGDEGQTYKLINASGMALGIEVTDERSGLPRTFSLPKSGDFCKLTRGQIDELRERAPHFFEKGWVSAPDVMEDNPNVIRNVEKFLAEIEFEGIEARIESITSLDTLFHLFHSIENKRFLSTDDRGQPFKDKIGGEDMLVVKEVKLSPKLRAVEMAVKQRIEALSDVKISLDAK